MKTTAERDADERLVARFQGGERRAFDEIDRRYRSRLVRFLRFRTKSQDVAEELTQETLTRAFAALDGLKRGEFLAGWLYRVAFRLFVDTTRRRLNAVPLDENANEADGAAGSNGVVFATENARRPNGAEFASAEPDARSIRVEEKTNLWRVAKDSLTADEFQTLWLRYVDESSDVEIGIALGKSPGAVRVSLTRARQKLGERLRLEADENQKRGPSESKNRERNPKQRAD